MAFFKLTASNIIIEQNKKSNIIYNDKTHFEYFNYYSKIKNDNKKYNYLNKQNENELLNLTNYIEKIFKLDKNIGILSINNYIDNNDNYVNHILTKDVKNKYDNIFSTQINNEKIYLEYSKIKNCDDRDNFIINMNMQRLHDLFYCLNKKGNALISLNNRGMCSNKTIEFIYLFTSLFEYSVILEGNLLLGYSFNPKIKQNVIKELFKKDFNIRNKNDLNLLIQYYETEFSKKLKLIKLLDNDKIEEYKFEIKNKSCNYLLKTENFKKMIIEKNLIDRVKLHIISYFNQLFYKNKTFIYNICYEFNKYVSKLIIENNYDNGLVIGMSFGVYITYLSYNKKISLIILKPLETTLFEEAELDLFKKFNLNKRNKLIEDNIYISLSNLLVENKKFNLILIQSLYNFDEMLAYIFVSDKLLKIGGILIILEEFILSNQKIISYLNNNYTWYEKLITPTSFVIYKKINNKNNKNNYLDF